MSAVERGYVGRSTVIPVMRPWLGQEEQDAVAAVIASGWIAQGSKVQAFEDAVAQRRRGRARRGGVQLHGGAPPRAARARDRPGRRGRGPVAVVHRDGELGRADRSRPRLRRRRGDHPEPHRRDDRGRADRADRRRHGRPPGRGAGRHGPDPCALPAQGHRHRRGRRLRARQHDRGRPGGLRRRAGRVLLPPPQDRHDRGGGHGRHLEPGSGRPPPTSARARDGLQRVRSPPHRRARSSSRTASRASTTA